MAKQFVVDIKDRDIVQAVFLVKDKIMAMAKNGKPYMILRFMDKSGEIEAKAIRTKRIAKGGTGDNLAIKPDYSGAMIETLSKIKTLAVQEAVAKRLPWKNSDDSN